MALERLQKIISARGYCSRRHAEQLIIQGRVKVDEQVVRELGSKFDDSVEISIDNKPIYKVKKKYYYLFNKPRLVLTTMSDPKDRTTVADFFKNAPTRVYPVGRLDYDVSGLILMTNDGEFANFVMHPRYEFLKTYQGKCEGQVRNEQIKKLLKGVKIGEEQYFTKAVAANLVKYDNENGHSVVELTIAEGHKHHVKNMFTAIDAKLLKLQRTKIEFLELDSLQIGQYRELKIHEIKKFYGIYNATKRKEDNNYKK